MKYSNILYKSNLAIASAVLFSLVGCSSLPNKTLDGKPLKKVPDNISVPVGSVLIAAVCVPDKSAYIEDEVRFGKIFKEGFSTKRLKKGYPEKKNDSYWFIQDLGELGKIQAFVLPDGYEGKQNLTYIWNIRDRRFDYHWTPWLMPDLKIKDISGYVDDEWGLVDKEDFNKKEDKSPFLVKFKRINYYELILEQLNEWNIYPIEPCAPGDLSKDVWLPNATKNKTTKDEKKTKEPELPDITKIPRIIKEIEVSVQDNTTGYVKESEK